MSSSSDQNKPVLLKLSGEALGPDGSAGLPVNGEKVSQFAAEIMHGREAGIRVCTVVGGGNIWRGANALEMDRPPSDIMGMLATIINGLALKAALISRGCSDEQVRVMSKIKMSEGCEEWVYAKARRYLEKGYTVIAVAGINEPRFTTDTAAVQRALDVDARVVLKGTNVDGVFSEDPKLNPRAERFSDLTFREAISRELRVMDGTALTHAAEFGLPIRVFDATVPGNVRQALMGEPIGTLIHP